MSITRSVTINGVTHQNVDAISFTLQAAIENQEALFAQYPHDVEVTTTLGPHQPIFRGQSDDIANWCRDNAKKGFKVLSGNTSWSGKGMFVTIPVRFEDKADATLFKMFWHD